MSDAAPSRGRRRHPEHEEHEEHVNHEAWVIPYADVLTLLMALFLVLWALGDTNDEKTEIAADSFRRELGGQGGVLDFDLGFGSGGGPLANGGISVLEGAGPAPMSSDADQNSVGSADELSEGTPPMADDPMEGLLVGVPREEIAPDDPRFDPMEGSLFDDEETSGLAGSDPGTGGAFDERDPLDVIEQAVRDEAVGSGLTTQVGFRREERGLVVSIVTDSVLFGEGSDDVRVGGVAILDVIASALEDTANPIIIEGHTDSRPISTPSFPSNWELSTARATSVLRFFIEDLGLPAGRFSAAGYADTRPIDEGAGPDALARNRRVEIVVIG